MFHIYWHIIVCTYCTSSLLLAFIWYLILFFALSGRQFEHLSLAVYREAHSRIKSLANNKLYLINYNKRHTELSNTDTLDLRTITSHTNQIWTVENHMVPNGVGTEFKEIDSLAIFTATHLFKLYTLRDFWHCDSDNQHEASFTSITGNLFCFYFRQYCQANIWQV